MSGAPVGQMCHEPEASQMPAILRVGDFLQAKEPTSYRRRRDRRPILALSGEGLIVA